MNEQLWSEEVARFVGMTTDAKLRWLIKLLFWTTTLSRQTYIVGGDSIREPVRMRRFNELAHRIASQLQAVFDGVGGVPNDVFAKLLVVDLIELKVDIPTLIRKLQNQ